MSYSSMEELCYGHMLQAVRRAEIVKDIAFWGLPVSFGKQNLSVEKAIGLSSSMEW